MTDKQPIYILPENVERTMGKDAQRNNILAAKLVSEAVKTTLGPKGRNIALRCSSVRKHFWPAILQVSRAQGGL